MKTIKSFLWRGALAVGIAAGASLNSLGQATTGSETVAGHVREQNGEFIIAEAYGPGMFRETKASGEEAVLRGAAELTSRIFQGDAEAGFVGRMNPLVLKIRRLEGGAELLSFGPAEEGP